jgi:hypothetical protein
MTHAIIVTEIYRLDDLSEYLSALDFIEVFTVNYAIEQFAAFTDSS